jgi:hypothetical protein
MRTRRTDVDKLEELSQPEFFAGNFPNALDEACTRGDPNVVRQLLELKNKNNEPLYSAQDAFIGIFAEPMTSFANYYNRMWSSEFIDKVFYDKLCIYPENKLKDRELCLRLIIQAVRKKIELSNPDLNSDEINKKVADTLINKQYGPQNQWGTPLLSYLTAIGSAASLINVIADEVGIKNIDFRLSYLGAKHYRSPMISYQVNFTLIESYLTEYLKSLYEGQENSDIYEELKLFFKDKADYLTYTMKDFPKHLFKAMGNAQNDLQGKYGEDFQMEKLKQAANSFEDKFIPDMYKIEESNRRRYRNIAIVLSFTIVGLVAWIWYAVKVREEPIKARETTQKAFDKYRTRNEKPTDIFVFEKTLEPIKHKEPHPGEDPDFRTRKVVTVSDKGKITVFSSSLNDQAEKFENGIRKAEKRVDEEAKQSRRGRGLV